VRGTLGLAERDELAVENSTSWQRKLGRRRAVPVAVTIVGKIRYAVATCLAGICLAALVAPPARAGTGEVPVDVGEVSAVAVSPEVDEGALRSMVVDAVGAIDATTIPKGAHAVLSVSVVRLDARGSSPAQPGQPTQPAQSAQVTCVVSATLRDAKRGSVFAVLEGSAHGEDAPARLGGLRRRTMRAAVASAIARVPEAMHRKR
jgi:predicted RecA/RadA family phage recombinase